MSQQIIGIDFSINSTAIAVRKDGSLDLFSFVPNYKATLSGFKTHEAIKDLVQISSYQKGSNIKDPMIDQSTKLKNADSLSDSIIEAIGSNIKDPKIYIEGFSFGSKGNSFIDLVTFNTFLKVKMIQKWGHVIYVVPPKTIKKSYTGNGNASKCDMLRQYFKSGEGLFKERLIELGLNREEDFVIPKPIDDLIDAIALTEIFVDLKVTGEN